MFYSYWSFAKGYLFWSAYTAYVGLYLNQLIAEILFECNLLFAIVGRHSCVSASGSVL